MKSAEQRRALVSAETAEYLQYRASNQTKQLLALYDALIDDHLADLITIPPERLQYKQGAIRQLQALRDMMMSENLMLSVKA